MNDILFKSLLIIVYFTIGFIVALLIGHAEVNGWSIKLDKSWSALAFSISWVVFFIEETIRLNIW